MEEELKEQIKASSAEVFETDDPQYNQHVVSHAYVSMRKADVDCISSSICEQYCSMMAVWLVKNIFICMLEAKMIDGGRYKSMRLQK